MGKAQENDTTGQALTLSFLLMNGHLKSVDQVIFVQVV